MAAPVMPSAVLLTLNESNDRLEIRDSSGFLVEEIFPGTASRLVDVGDQEYRLSFGLDDWSRPSLIVRPGPAMRKPVSVDVLGRKTILSPEASLLATIHDSKQVTFEPSICGQIYYIEELAGTGSSVSRLASAKQEIAVLAKPSSEGGSNLEAGRRASAAEDGKAMEKAGESVKAAFYTLFGLPDKQPSGKAKVYRLRSQEGAEPMVDTAPPVSAQAGRPTSP